MTSFKNECVGGPCDGSVIDLGRVPQDGERQVSERDGAAYQFSWSKMRWLFVGYVAKHGD